LVVGGIVVLQWLILLIKPALERLIYLDEQEQVGRIQELRDRVLTTRDLQQFLEYVLAGLCDLLQVGTAFVASFSPDGSPHLELILGELATSNGNHLPQDGWQSLKLDPLVDLPEQGERFSWDGYWILSLYDQKRETVLGILGVQTPDDSVNLTQEQIAAMHELASQAAATLEDRLLQQEVFSAMEGLLHKVKAAQRRRQTAALGQAGQPSSIDERQAAEMDLTNVVRDALSHYWGGPKLTQSPLLKLQVVRQGMSEHQGSSVNAIRSVLAQAIESLRPEGDRNMTTAEWILYNILELKFLRRYKVRDIARRLAMSESDLYRKQRVAIEAVSQAIAEMERAAIETDEPPQAMQEVNAEQKAISE
jgi:GAF domain-containing protein